MKPAAFFRTPEVQAVLERACRAAGTPLSVHYVDRGEEGVRITGFGRCAACRMVSELPGGPQKCRESRVEASVPALRRNKPVAFICHMGFACVSMPALPGSGLGFTLTFGPYCPSDAPQSLETDAQWGFSALGVNPEEGLPVSLADIHLAPADAVPTIAEWTAEALTTLWQARLAAEEAGAATEEDEETSSKEDARVLRRTRYRTAGGAPFGASPIATALASGNAAQARKLVAAALIEIEGGSRARIEGRRARTVAIVSAVLEVAHRANLNAAPCWERFPAFLETLRQARTNEALIAAAMDVLGLLRRRVKKDADDPDGLAEMSRIILARLTDGVTLNEVAQELGQHPTAITHRLQRRFGLSFSEYVGQLRVSMAKDLLRTTRLSAGEISRRVGIKDGSNLSKLFRKFEGMSPQEYRRRFGRAPR
jgi:AraC-like DNA-binding protein